ncbi:MAG TPA: aldehyde dehydrogenase family protein [Polyangia bacterium]|nr:aldehyde dehydrogenase family protein [Polyangia bacterium]
MPAAHALRSFNEDGAFLVDGVISHAASRLPVTSPLCLLRDGRPERPLIGEAPHLSTQDALAALDAAARAWNNGRGAWPTMSVAARIERVEAFGQQIRPLRETVARLLMWEIGKTWPDALKEFDRTLEYIHDTVEALKELDRKGSRFEIEKGVVGMVRRAPLGVVLCMGPYNYPLNETFTTLIPALIMGNAAIVKLPRMGLLCHLPLLKAFADCFPAGVVNVLAGDGETISSPFMKSGRVDVLAFIGSSRVGDLLKHQHPKPHRLRSVLGLDAKNPAIVLEDADLDLAARECVRGALSFNGQRCTALKILFVPASRAEALLEKLCAQVEALPVGMPWEEGAFLTPLPETSKPERMAALVEDARRQGARVVNPNGGKTRATFYFPSVVYPVSAAMQLYHVEQFGPIIPVVPYRSLEELYSYFDQSPYGQQASVFGHDPAQIGPLLDGLANQVCRVNLNTQCQRGPDTFPFTGRKDSAEGTLSVSDALRVFSIRSMVAASYDKPSKQLLTDIVTGRSSHFLRTDYIL